MKHDNLPDDARREFLLRSLQLGLLTGGLGWQPSLLAGLLGELPAPLPAGRSIFELRGPVTVNGRTASKATPIKAGDRVSTGPGGLVIATVNSEAFLLRGDSELLVQAGRASRSLFRLVNGALLAVFGKRDEEYQVHTPVATIGIRGTGIYAEADPEQTYLCTCYGETRLEPLADPGGAETLRTQHHDAPRTLLAKPSQGRYILPAGFRDHTDLELMTLEALVGREVPFELPEDGYERPRRRY